MAFQTFTCVICKDQTTKPKSFAYQGGRACRTHPEAQLGHVQAVEKEKQQKDYAASKPKKKFGYASDYDLRAFGYRDPNTFCWHCNKEGVYEHVMLYRCLVNMSKAKLNGMGTVNPFDANSPHYELTRKELNGRELLKRFPINQSFFPDWKLFQLVKNRDLAVAGKMAGVVIICQPCAVEFNFAWDFDKPSFENVKMSDLAFLGFVVEHATDEIAMGEILDRIFKEGPRT